MNGQQLTNSSNSANGTPSSSYPASLSSQSSRDPSPATRPGAPRKPFPESYNHVPVINSQSNHWTSKNPGNDAHSIPTSLHSSHPAEFQEEPNSTYPPPSQFQQPVYRFPPSPTPAQSNHLPPNNPTHPTQTSQSTETSRSTQSPVQQPPKQHQALPTFQSPPSNNFSQQPNQFSQLSNLPPQQPNQFSQLPNQYQKHSNQLPSQQPNQFPQPPVNQFSQQPSQLSHPSINQFQKPLPVIVQPQQNQSHRMTTGQGYQFNQPNQMPQPPIPALPPQNTFASPPVQPYQNQFPPNNQFGQPPNQMFNPQTHTQPLNQFSQLPIQVSQPLNHLPAPPGPGHNPPQPPYPQPQQRYPTPAQQQTPNQFNKRYPQMAQQPGYQPCPIDGLAPQVAGMSIQQGFNKMWGMDTVDLLKCRDLLPQEKLEPPAVRLQHELYEAANCSPEIFRCTLTKIPETKSLLDKSRLPLGVLIHPFKDLNQLSVIQCTVIVRCRMCRTYINPFVYFVDNKRWKCNLCFRVNELPDEFQFDPMTKTYGDPSRRPEIKSATIEFIAPSEYMVRPPQPAIYVFVLDVSRLACESGYLQTVCRTLLSELENVPGDARTSVAFITFDSAVHFYSLTEGQGQPHQMIVVDIDDMFLPTPDNLLVSLNECRELIKDLLQELPEKYRESYDTHSALGAALQAAYKLLAPTGGRVTVFQACLPNAGPGALTAREDPAQRAGDNPPHLNPATDFYKKLALDCSGQQIAVDLFLVNRQYVDLATLSGVSRFSGGCMHHLPLYSSDKPLHIDALERMFQRYLTRKIGFESVMRLRCTRGLSIHTFHGNFFVRSTDLLSLPNANPDAGFGMQVSIEENLTEIQNVCFQAALLYTSSKGERRIRVHTLCLPVASNLADIIHGADQQCIVGLLAKMAVDRAIQSSLSDAREAFVNVVADTLSTYKATQSSNTVGCLMAPSSLRLLPLYILALLKHTAFRIGQSTRLDDRLFDMCQMKSLPLTFLMQSIYPDLYCVTHLVQQPEVDGVHRAPRLQLSSERVDSLGLYLLDDGVCLLLYVGHNLDPAICQAVFDVPNFSAISPELYSLPELDSPMSTALRNFIAHLQNEKPYPLPLQVIRDDSNHHRMRFLERLIEDKNESGTSYYEFLKRIQALVK